LWCRWHGRWSPRCIGRVPVQRGHEKRGYSGLNGSGPVAYPWLDDIHRASSRNVVQYDHNNPSSVRQLGIVIRAVLEEKELLDAVTSADFTFDEWLKDSRTSTPRKTKALLQRSPRTMSTATVCAKRRSRS